MKARSIAILTIIAGPTSLGASLSIPSGNQTLLSDLVYSWSAAGQGAGGGESFDFNQVNLIHVVNETDGATFGVSSSVNLITTFTPDTITISKGPGFATIPIQAEGHASIVGDLFDYDLRVGTATNNGGVPSYTPWQIQIDPAPSEFIGQPAVIHVEATVSGAINSGGEPFSSANWFVKVNGQNLIIGGHIIIFGFDPFTDANTIDIQTSIGSTVSLQAEGRLLGSVNLSSPGAVEASGIFSTFRITVSLRIPACDADLNADGVVDTADLGLLISAFGSINPAADINGDGVVDTADLGLLIASFGHGCGSNAL